MLANNLFVGLDLGQASDPTALAVVERSWQCVPRGRSAPPQMVPYFACRHLKRWPLGTAYTAIVGDVNALTRRRELVGATLVVDGTGVGRAVVDLLRETPVRCPLQPVLITAGHAVTCEEGWWHVPKRELASTLQALLQTERLKVARALPEAATLEREFLSFTVKITTAGNETFEAWRERDHDDLVLAVALATWFGSQERPTTPPAVLYGGVGRMSPVQL